MTTPPSRSSGQEEAVKGRPLKNVLLIAGISGFVTGYLAWYGYWSIRDGDVRAGVAVLLPGAHPIDESVQSLVGRKFVSKIAELFQRSRQGIELSPQESAEMRGMVVAWMSSAPVECLNFLYESSVLSLLDGETVEAAFQQAGDGNPVEQINLARNLKSGPWQDRIIGSAYAKLIATDPQTALDSSSTLPPHLRQRLRNQLLKSWVNSAGASAVEAILKSPAATTTMVRDASLVLAKKDEEAALRFLDQTPDASFRAKTEVGKIYFLGQLFPNMDPKRVVDYLSPLPSSPFRDNQMIAYVGAMIAANPDSAGQIVRKLKGDIAAGQALQFAAIKAGRNNNPKVAQQLLDNIPGERSRSEAAEIIIHELADKNPQDAVKWANTIADPVTKYIALQQANALVAAAAKVNK